MHHVLYVAEDKAGNKARCEFNITIAGQYLQCAFLYQAIGVLFFLLVAPSFKYCTLVMNYTALFNTSLAK